MLLISPAFLSSTYIWSEDGEMPRLRAHEAGGMRILPLVVRPCAWKLEEELRARQVRPVGDRALSEMTESQVDAELTAFVYELAGGLGRPAPGATVHEREAAQPSATGGGLASSTWRGRYAASGRDLRLSIETDDGTAFTGAMAYEGQGTITRVEGHRVDDRTVRFRELAAARDVVSGHAQPERGGEYRARVEGHAPARALTGVYVNGHGRELGSFRLHEAAG